MEPETNQNSNAKSALFIGLIVALAAINGFLFYNWKQQKNRNEQLEKELGLTDSLKRNLEGEKEVNISRIGELESQNASKDTLIQLQEEDIANAKARLAELSKKQKLTAAELSEAKTLIKSLRAAEVRFKLKIDSFLTVNEGLINEKSKLIDENTQLKSNLEQSKQTSAKLETEKSELIQTAQVLKVSNVSFVGYQRKGSKESVTDKSNKVDKIEIKFDVLENPIAKNENKTAYVRVLDPNGMVLSDNTSSGLSVQGKACSKKVDFTYNNQGSNAKTTLNVNTKLPEGRYTVEVYIDDQLAGKGSDNLRKTLF